MSRFLGSKNTKEVHDTLNEKEQCQLNEIKPDHKKWFDSLATAQAEGFDNCAWCIGGSKR
jgi:hypothetical protein